MKHEFDDEIIYSFIDVVSNVAKIGGWVAELSDRSVFWTKQTYNIFAAPQGSNIMLKDAVNFFLPGYRERIRALFNTASNDGKPFQFEAQIRDLSGQVKWIMIHGRPILNEQQQPVKVVGIFEDISQRVADFEKIKSQQQYLTSVVNNILEGLIVIDERGLIRSFNSAAADIFGYQEQQVLDKNIAILMPDSDASRHDGYMQHYHNTSLAKIIGIGREVMGKRKNGDVFPLYLSIAEVDIKGRRHYLGTIRDLSQEKTHAEKINWLSNYDDLTGLPNRNFLLNYLSECVNGQSVLLIAINIDRFKRIYLAYGQEKSDGVIKAIARRLQNHTTQSDFLCRDLADRFWLVLKGDKLNQPAYLEDKLESLKQLLEQPVCLDEQRHYITATLGAALSTPASQATNLLSKAELALHDAKRKGNGFYNIYHGEQRQTDILQAYDTERQLREAIDNNELMFYLQPKHNPQGALVSAELLVRWQKADGQMVYPDAFIGIAEETGLIQQIGEQGIQQAAKMLSELTRLGCGISLAVNVSPLQFLSDKFVESIVQAFKQHEVPVNRLIVEVTENLLIADFELVQSKLRQLEDMGVKISIDDFGTGYSNLQRIQQLTISEVKIDKSFTWKCLEQQGSELVNAMIQIGKSMKLTVVAEGLESEEQMQVLNQMGVDVYQGYYFNKPMPFEDFIQQL